MDDKPFADGILKHTTGLPKQSIHSTYLREVLQSRPKGVAGMPMMYVYKLNLSSGRSWTETMTTPPLTEPVPFSTYVWIEVTEAGENVITGQSMESMVAAVGIVRGKCFQLARELNSVSDTLYRDHRREAG